MKLINFEKNTIFIKLLLYSLSEERREIKMNIEEILLNNDIRFKEIEYEEEIKVYKIGLLNQINVVVLFSNSNTFKVDKDLIYYLTNQKENYSFWLINTKDNEMFYLQFNDKNNWLEMSVNRSTKEKIYFGKIVLNHKLNQNGILQKLLSY